jgi:hypothetical protein
MGSSGAGEFPDFLLLSVVALDDMIILTVH